MKKFFLILFVMQCLTGCAWSVQNMPYPEEAPWQAVPARGPQHRVQHHRPGHGHQAPAQPARPGHPGGRHHRPR